MLIPFLLAPVLLATCLRVPAGLGEEYVLGQDPQDDISFRKNVGGGPTGVEQNPTTIDIYSNLVTSTSSDLVLLTWDFPSAEPTPLFERDPNENSSSEIGPPSSTDQLSSQTHPALLPRQYPYSSYSYPTPADTALQPPFQQTTSTIIIPSQPIVPIQSRTNFRPTILVPIPTASSPPPTQPTTLTTNDVPPVIPSTSPSTLQSITPNTATSSLPMQTANPEIASPQISVSIFQTTTTVSFAPPSISTPSTASTSPSKGISRVAIAGIAVGIVGAVAFIGGVLFCCLRRRHVQVYPVIKGEIGEVIREEFDEDGFVATRYAGNYGRASPWELHGARTFGEY